MQPPKQSPIILVRQTGTDGRERVYLTRHRAAEWSADGVRITHTTLAEVDTMTEAEHLLLNELGGEHGPDNCGQCWRESHEAG
ncbi:hypothetical protein [Actinomadura sp. 3N508]|uniref:hypothetical protein n=1 Tax=Actinomadura sp. 3N508 TaxID=3375153 RepID=UPI003794FC99